MIAEVIAAGTFRKTAPGQPIERVREHTAFGKETLHAHAETTMNAFLEEVQLGTQLAELLNRLAAGGLEVRVLYTTGNWLDVDSLYDVIQAARFGS